MSIKGYVDPAEVDAKLGGSDNRVFIVNVANGMRENPGKCPDLDVCVKTKAEAQKKVNQLNKQRYKMSPEYLKMIFVLAGKDDSDFKVFARECEPAKKKSGKKNGGPATAAGNSGKTTKKAQKTEQAAAPESIAATKNDMIKAIEHIPAQMLPIALAQYQGKVTEKQEELAKPGITEEAAGKVKEEIQILQEVIEAIRKKIGQ